MAITREQALTASEFHVPGDRPCESKTGPMRWRRNGKTRTWKRTPERFEIPVKFGLWNHAHITNQNSSRIHTLEDCPVEIARREAEAASLAALKEIINV